MSLFKALSAIEELNFRWMLCSLQQPLSECTSELAREVDEAASNINRRQLSQYGNLLTRSGDDVYYGSGHFRLEYDLISASTNQVLAKVYIYSTARIEYYPDVVEYKLVLRPMVAAVPLVKEVQAQRTATLSEFLP